MRSLLRAPGKPLHPPLTDASIGAYTAGSFLVFLGWFGVVEEKLAWGGFLAIAAGLVLGGPDSGLHPTVPN